MAAQASLDPAKLVFLDEAGVDIAMSRDGCVDAPTAAHGARPGAMTIKLARW